MARVHTFDPNCGIEIAYESPWGTVATAGFIRVHPIIEPGDSLNLIRSIITPPRTFAETGGRTSYDAGRPFVQGAITMIPSYNSEAFGTLIREAHGGVNTLAGTGGEGPAGLTPGGTPSGYKTHVFYPAPWTLASAPYEGGIGAGLTIRVWKSGATDDGHIDRFVGCIVTGFVWDQPENQPPRVTFSFIGKQLAPLLADTLTITAVPAGLVQMKYRDFCNRPTQNIAPGICKSGPALANDLNLRSFRLNFDNGIEIAPAFVNAPDTVLKPFHANQYQATGELVGALEMEYGETGKPHREWIDGTGSAFRVRYVSNTNVYDGGSEANRMPYAFDMWCDDIRWTGSNPNLTEFGSSPHRLTYDAGRAVHELANHAWSTDIESNWLLQIVSSKLTIH